MVGMSRLKMWLGAGWLSLPGLGRPSARRSPGGGTPGPDHDVLVSLGTVVHHAVLVTATPGNAFRPTPTALPGGAALQTIVNGIGGWALIIALAGLVIGAAMWAIGAHSQNYQQSFVGKRAVLVSGLAALVIGAAPVIIDFFFHTGLHIPLPQ